MAKNKAKEIRPVGRPSSYDPKYCDQLIEYFSEPPYKEILKKIVTKDGDVVEVPAIEATDFKSFAGFAVSIGTHRGTLNDWCNQHPEFADAYKRAKEYQEKFLTINGNKGLINPAFGIFTAKNVIDYRDKKDIEVKDTTPREKMSDEELEAEIQRRLENK